MLATYYDHRSHQILPMTSNPLTQADLEQRNLTGMEISMTPGQLEKRNTDAMGDALGKQYTILLREVSTLFLYARHQDHGKRSALNVVAGRTVTRRVD